MKPLLVTVVLGLLSAGCGPTPAGPPPREEAPPPTAATRAATPTGIGIALDVVLTDEACEEDLRQELSRLAGMGPRAAAQIGRVLEISRWSPELDRPARAALEKIDPTGRLRVRPLLELLAGDTRGVDYPGIVPMEEFKRLGAIAREPLLEVVAGPPCLDRSDAISILAWLHGTSDEVFPVLTAISRDPDDPQRGEALCGLYHAAPGTPGLLAELRRAGMLWRCTPGDGEDVQAWAAVWPELIGLLNDLLTSPDLEERRHAVRCLKGATNLPEEILPALTATLEDADLETRVDAALALARLEPGLTEVDEKMSAVLAEAFETGYRGRLEEAERALRHLGPRARSAAPLLARLLRDDDWTAGEEIARALRWIDAPEVAIPALLGFMEKPLPDGDLPPFSPILNYRMKAATISLAAYGDSFPSNLGTVTISITCQCRHGKR